MCTYTGICQSTVEKYYSFVNKAELSICSYKNKAASKYYKRAFKMLKVPFSVDVKNVFLCEYYGSQNKNRLIVLAKLLKGAGVLIEDIIPKEDRNDVFASVLLHQQEADIKYNLIFSKKIDSLQKIDKYSRILCPAYHDSCKEAVRYSDSLNMIKLIEIEKEYGKAREASIGKMSVFFLNVLMGHWIMWNWYPMREELREDVMRGIYDARQFARLEDKLFMYSNNQHLEYGVDSYFIVGGVLFISVNDTKAEIDKRRKSLFLETLDELGVKTLFQVKNKKYLFNPHLFTLVLGDSLENVNKAKELMEKIDNGKINGNYYNLNK